MPKKKNAGGVSIQTGNISDTSGSVNIAGGDIHNVNTGMKVAEIKSLFDQLYTNIDARPEIPPAKKEDVKAEVQDIQTVVTEAVKKNEPVDENVLSRKFRSIARMAPDILEVVAATVANPALGIGVAVKKIAEKAKEEA
jgi:hypothetical protein